MSIDNVSVWSEKNSYHPCLDIFLEEDKYENPIINDKEAGQDMDIDIGYQVSLRIAKFRMALCGYTIGKVKAKYNAWAAEKNTPPDNYHESGKLPEQFYLKYAFDDYAALLKSALLNLNKDHLYEFSSDEDYVMSAVGGYHFGFPSKDPNYVLTLLLHLIEGENLRASLSGTLWDHKSQLGAWDNPLIILTEGKTDNEVLRESFNLLYPDHCRTIRFFDYEFRPEGGAGNNVKLLKSFAAAGIRELILAIFDNDTAGHKALQDARKLRLPDNFMLAAYPDITIAANYPTLGPSGLEHLDVNQSACGIEMYLGNDCLTKDGTLIPVRWTGYDEVMKRYQGEVGDKQHVLKLFREKVKLCRDDPTGISRIEWGELHSIMKAIEIAVFEKT